MLDRDVAIVIPSLGRPHLRTCLEFLNPRYKDVYVVQEGRSWPEAVNIGLQRAGARDVLLMDDDILIGPKTFDFLEEYYDSADMFGFKLWFPDGTLQHAGGAFENGAIRHRFYGQVDTGQADEPVYLPHVTTSLCYIKADMVKRLGGMAVDYPGMQFEDVDFCFRGLKAGYKILYTPGGAIHMESFSKKHLPQFNIKMTQNMLELRDRFLLDPEFIKILGSYPQHVLAEAK